MLDFASSGGGLCWSAAASRANSPSAPPTLAEARNLKAPVARISSRGTRYRAHSLVFACRPKKTQPEPWRMSLREGAVGLPVRPKAALALALCGDVGQAQSLANDIALKYPQSTLSQAVWLPMIRAAVELRRGNALTKPSNCCSRPASMKPWGSSGPIYLRGQAYLRLKMGPEAAVRVSKDSRPPGLGSCFCSPPASSFGSGAGIGGHGGCGQEPQVDIKISLHLWKDADPDLPILVQAKREYKKLR